MNAEEYLKGLNKHDPVFDMDTEYEYTERQLINFAERYHQNQLKLLRIGVVSESFYCLSDSVKGLDSMCDRQCDNCRHLTE